VGAVASLGFNTIRLHQKVNPERWYYAADRLGVLVMQVCTPPTGVNASDRIVV